ncbi:MAG TPA: GGDEF domain-containing protein, partial [Rheinheimera sp.]|nr:GGDEF domain-containing protein [Rheinheimera sp.]
GEEYAVLLVDTPVDQAAVLAERLRQSVEALQINYNAHQIKVTLSIGLAEYNADMTGHRQWIEASDKGLYQSKANGRNQVTLYIPE